MSEIERILKSGKSAQADDVSPVSEKEIRTAEATLRFAFPPSYREFVALGGLRELCINHRVLSPAEMIESVRYINQEEYVPFADNGCGDLYCWQRAQEAEPRVVFSDHETNQYTADAESFTDWLAKNKF